MNDSRLHHGYHSPLYSVSKIERMNSNEEFNFSLDFHLLKDRIEYDKRIKYEQANTKSEIRHQILLDKKVGFFVKENSTKFISIKNNFENSDFQINHDKITAIAFGNRSIGDNDQFYIVFFQHYLDPTYFTFPALGSAEMNGLEIFVNKLKEVIEFKPIKWENNKVILAYPNDLRGEELYEKWWKSLRSLFLMLSRVVGSGDKYGGSIKKHLKKELLKSVK